MQCIANLLSELYVELSIFLQHLLLIYIAAKKECKTKRPPFMVEQALHVCGASTSWWEDHYPAAKLSIHGLENIRLQIRIILR